MNRTLKEATVKQYHYGSHDQLKQHLHAFVMAYNFAERLKMLKGLTPYDTSVRSGQKILIASESTPSSTPWD
jgi:hypothetical protein